METRQKPALKADGKTEEDVMICDNNVFYSVYSVELLDSNFPSKESIQA